jgi:hypothetical protein
MAASTSRGRASLQRQCSLIMMGHSGARSAAARATMLHCKTTLLNGVLDCDFHFVGRGVSRREPWVDCDFHFVGRGVSEGTMGTLVFVCPATGAEVSTGIEMDLATLQQLELSKVYCPLADSSTKWLAFRIG